jgi:hypothetical protein
MDSMRIVEKRWRRKKMNQEGEIKINYKRRRREGGRRRRGGGGTLIGTTLPPPHCAFVQYWILMVLMAMAKGTCSLFGARPLPLLLPLTYAHFVSPVSIVRFN